MNGRAPDVSVIIPTRNRAVMVMEAVRSVLCQSRARLEVIVIDDGSSDDAAVAVCELSPVVRYLYRPASGPAAARNHGIREANAPLLAFLDDDDLWSADKLALQLPVLREQPETAVVLGHTQRMVLRESSTGVCKFVKYMDPMRLFSFGCGLFRREVFDRVGLLDEKMLHAEDDDWFMRARAKRIGIEFIGETTLFYRFHGSNMSTEKEKKHPDMLRLVKNRLDRIRSGQGG